MQPKNIFVSFSFKHDNEWKKRLDIILNNNSLTTNMSETVNKSHLSDQQIWNDLISKVTKSSITIVLLSIQSVIDGKFDYGRNFDDSKWPYCEISASLRDWKNNRINGVIVLIKDDEHSYFIENSYDSCCGATIKYKNLPEVIDKNRNNVVKKFKKHICPNVFDYEEDTYITIIKQSEFENNPIKYIESAFKKKVRVTNGREGQSEFDIVYDFHNK